MLVLSRKINERIKIGENVWITIVKLNGGRVSLGIEAPRSIAINREEIATHDNSITINQQCENVDPLPDLRSRKKRKDKVDTHMSKSNRMLDR